MRKLNGNPVVTTQQFFENISGYLQLNPLSHDKYGSGSDKQAFEQAVADDFGYEAAVFMPSGVMAQLIALRIVCDEKGNNTFAMHSSCHLEKHEEMAYSTLHQLEACLIGSDEKVPVASDIKKIESNISALVYELPMRHLGGAMPEWQELEEIKTLCLEENIHLHIDGARLWETQIYYGRSLPEINRGVQSCYVSFYKGIGSTSGAMLMGSESLVDQARLWLRRHGGDLYQLSALWIPAKYNYDRAKSRFAGYYQQALTIAETLMGIKNIQVTPYPLQTNMMHVLIPGEPEDLLEKMKQLDDQLNYSCLLSCWGKDSARPEMTRFELYVGESAGEISRQEVFEYFNQITSWL